MASLKSIKSSDDKLEIVNQLLLPHTTQYIQINTIEEAHDAIKTMKVGCMPIYFGSDLLVDQRFVVHQPLVPWLHYPLLII
jgi:hypothetical protein